MNEEYQFSPQFGIHKIRALQFENCTPKLLNINQMGIGLETRSPLPIGQSYVFVLTCEGRIVSLEGVVSRSALFKVTENSAGETITLYHIGVEFHIERSTKEDRLYQVLRASLLDEKRLIPARLEPIQNIWVDVGRPIFKSVRELNERGVLFESDEMLDNDHEWPLLILIEEYAVRAQARILSASKHEDSETCLTHMEFLAIDPATEPLLILAAEKLNI